VLTAVAALKLRAWSSEEQSAETTTTTSPTAVRRGERRLPPIGENVMLWKELYAEPGYRPHPLAHALLIITGGAFLSGALLMYLVGIILMTALTKASEYMTLWVQAVGTPIAFLMIVMVALRASRSVGSERERQTLDSLLTTPLTNAAILRGKWLGAMLGVRQGWWCLGAIWLLGFLAGGLHVLSLLLLLVSWWVYAAFAAGVGLSFSLWCRTTLRATIGTLMTVLVIGVFLGYFCDAAMQGFIHDYSGRQLGPPDPVALTLPGAMAYLAFGWGNWYTFDANLKSIREVGTACLTVGAYGFGIVLCWIDLRERFGRTTRRMPYR
jgi:hypothetical protein